ncbi:MAG: 3-alpha,7-alpha,12-alpha-trihydroxy-5-beta-cholest-24-enoyl-CoA hydratase [Rhodospirillaceae bacterium]|jgi:acyl dehydratase|nr:3-alpha,7-alpha,12-alpha-trihydroxy-5-beta-cholest-24-enoyl-CoA hydratase [Rhodospirillaceae bacterium]MBT4042540.1 3-alpha,7-alpha,12-alpha-trihydroxy-5-beta-cholest-24-enoyl-CoA hydratase [Rhodospirillaceae bacterium]MBT5083323.1 3-alpha,7-alpha,12-alpha-trihydroxy-5-beta-cholest-24-enoyl-CoA hydratase [Rhodospirillaceae bacterium]MBT5526215.1 3-alpha,7-alpha,12-alpha-trihydroxy-5-beta-cholest-24-enoyl-CoA hydratase [Rhodospirillaceae bacterium]MBT5882297.1 3-alpha,7-alpha,12-alpha-trihydr
MAIDYDKIMNWPFEEVVQSYDTRDSILYALGVGLNMDPLDEEQLRFTYEDNMNALPTMAVVLGTPGFWVKDPDSGIDWVKVLHGEQGMVLHKPLPPAATVTATTKVTEIIDKGEGKGALLLQERTVTDQATGDKLATLYSTTFARGDGGFGGPTTGARPVHSLPEREPDMVCDLPTLPQAALIYRLSGDYNPLHADPNVAKGGGFKAPILHGLCSFGVAGHAILKSCCDYDPSRFKSMNLRFSAPVYPGETIRTEMWKDDNVISFRAKVLERDVMVLNNGRADVG